MASTAREENAAAVGQMAISISCRVEELEIAKCKAFAHRKVLHFVTHFLVLGMSVCQSVTDTNDCHGFKTREEKKNTERMKGRVGGG